MTSGTRAVEQAILDSHDFGRFALAVDIGGSHANLIGGLLQQHAQARGIVFDLPGTVEEGRAGLEGRALRRAVCRRSAAISSRACRRPTSIC